MDFLLAAAPFVVIGFCVAVLCANHKKWGSRDNYMLSGMSIGMCLGVSVSVALDANLGLGISIGMLLGMTVGLFIKKGSDS